jgi:DNA-nicking Smr family endonuclease
MSESRSIDLHNYTVAEAIREFVRFYNACVRSRYRGRIEVIHGYGSNGVGGAIREELRKYLKAHAATFGEYLAGESLRNPGVTILYAKESPAPPPQP